MLISIVTIVKNNRAGLLKTIQSLQNQSDLDFEYIVVDGFSTDGTYEEVLNHKNLITKFVHESDNGLSDAFNKGIHLSEGDYILFLNSGDAFVDNNSIASAKKAITTNKADVVFFKVALTNNSTIPDSSYKDNGDLVWKEANIPHQGAFINREVFTKYGLYNTNFKIRMDYELFARLSYYKCTHVFIPEIICSYEIGGISMKKENRVDFWREGFSVKLLYGLPLKLKDYIKLLFYSVSGVLF